MRMFWSLFFLGSLLLVGFDVVERRQTAVVVTSPAIANDGLPLPTPRPE